MERLTPTNGQCCQSVKGFIPTDLTSNFSSRDTRGWLQVIHNTVLRLEGGTATDRMDTTDRKAITDTGGTKVKSHAVLNTSFLGSTSFSGYETIKD